MVQCPDSPSRENTFANREFSYRVFDCSPFRTQPTPSDLTLRQGKIVEATKPSIFFNRLGEGGHLVCVCVCADAAHAFDSTCRQDESSQPYPVVVQPWVEPRALNLVIWMDLFGPPIPCDVCTDLWILRGFYVGRR
jgi:hypothetical protein